MPLNPSNHSQSQSDRLAKPVGDHAPPSVRSRCHGEPPLTAHLMPWMIRVIESGDLADWVHRFASPLNVLTTEPMAENIHQLSSAASARALDLDVFFAHKANKCRSFLNEAFVQGIGVDVASEPELVQAIAAGFPPERLICTAAIKPQSLVDRCLRTGVLVVVDNSDELSLIGEVARSLGCTPSIAIRLGGFLHDGRPLATRFGFDASQSGDLITRLAETPVQMVGIQFHLDGDSIEQRVSAIAQSLGWIERLRQAGHAIEFLDIGGGVPVSWLDDPTELPAFWNRLGRSLTGSEPEITYRNHSLGMNPIQGTADQQAGRSPSTYPTFAKWTGGQWLGRLLDQPLDAHKSPATPTVAQAIAAADIRLRCEPGRWLMRGCGMTVARVEFCKSMTRPDQTGADWFVGLAMNRTQCRTTSDDFLVDPIVVPANRQSSSPNGSMQTTQQTTTSGYLVGGYCTESELIALRRLHFPAGIRRRDLVVFPDTAGYWMHFMESRSHQFPLARNVFLDTREDPATTGRPWTPVCDDA